MSVLKSVLVLSLCTVAAIVGFSSAGAGRLPSNTVQAQSAAPATQSDQSAAPQEQAVQPAVRALGELDADGIYQLSFSRAGQVAEILVHKGDYVLAGTPLARLDNDRERLAVERAWLNVQLEEMRLEDLQEVDDDTLRIAEADLQAAQAAYSDVASRVRPEDIQAAELRYQQAYDAYIAANEARQIANGSPEYIASLDAKIGEASFNMGIAQLTLEDLRGSNQADLNAAGARIRQAQLQLEQVQAGPTQRQLDDQQLVIEQAEVAREQAELDYARTVLLAPVDGVVGVIDIEVGERVRGGAPALTIADLTPLEAVVHVDEVDLRLVEVGMPAQLVFDALPGVTLTGQINEIPEVGDEVNGVIKYAVRISLDVTDARLRPGMTTTASISTDTRSTADLTVQLGRVETETGLE